MIAPAQSQSAARSPAGPSHAATSQAGGLVLSLFPGIGLLDRGFEAEGFCVVRGPDLIFGGDVREFHPPVGHFAGVIGGPPCPDFSRARRSQPTGYGVAMLREFLRVVAAAQPQWWLMENVPCVPDVALAPYHVQRLDMDARECGLSQSRLRHFQFGCFDASQLAPERGPVTATGESQPTCMATEGRRAGRRGWAEFCSLQGLPPLSLPSFTVAAKYAAVGNGVPLPMARAIARAVTARGVTPAQSLCECGCGRALRSGQSLATAACRQRASRARRFGKRGPVTLF